MVNNQISGMFIMSDEQRAKGRQQRTKGEGLRVKDVFLSDQMYFFLNIPVNDLLLREIRFNPFLIKPESKLLSYTKFE